MIDVSVTKLGDPMAIDAIIALARALGATWIETVGKAGRGRLDHRVVWALMRHHVFEHQLALGQTAQQRAARVETITTARSVANIHVRLDTDPERERLATWLAVERTKLLMASKADAIATLDRELFKSRRQLPEVAAVAVRAVAYSVLEPFRDRVRVETEKPLAAFARRLVAELEDGLVDSGEVLSRDAIAGIELPPEVDLEEDGSRSNPGSIGGAVAWLGGASRRISETSRSALVDELEVGSLRAMTAALRAYDAGLIELHHRFCEVLDGLVESVKAAAEFADRAQRGGNDDVARAHRQVDDWFASLSEIARRLG